MRCRHIERMREQIWIRFPTFCTDFDGWKIPVSNGFLQETPWKLVEEDTQEENMESSGDCEEPSEGVVAEDSVSVRFLVCHRQVF